MTRQSLPHMKTAGRFSGGYPGDYLTDGEAYQACTKMTVPDLWKSIFLSRACRKTPLKVMGYLLASLLPLDGRCFSVLPDPVPFRLTCRSVPDPACTCSDCR